jgi:hypothetical protein
MPAARERMAHLRGDQTERNGGQKVAEEQNRALRDLSVDIENLYREEVFTDLGAASIRRLTPVKLDGSDDPSRPPLYIGETSLMTQMGPLPVQFPMEVDTLDDACRQFPEGVKTAVERLNERAREAMRDEASRIVVPTAVPPGMGGGMPGAGPMRGPGGKIVLDK